LAKAGVNTPLIQILSVPAFANTFPFADIADDRKSRE
jgi:hypothetical protein